MRVLVCGGRHYHNRDKIFRVLDKVHKEVKITLVIHGDSLGADSYAKDWAYYRQIPNVRVPALWREHEKAAGPIRNRKMIKMGKPKLVVAFPGGSGTADMKKAAKKVGIKVRSFI